MLILIFCTTRALSAFSKMDADEKMSAANSQAKESNVNSEEQQQSQTDATMLNTHSYAKVGPACMDIFAEPILKPLDVDSVVEILKNVEKYESFVGKCIPPNPKPGNVFLFMPKQEDEQGNYRKDEFMWVNHGPKAIPAKDPVIQKRYYVAKLPDGRPSKFHKNVYTLLNDIRELRPCIVHYLGSMDGISISVKKSRIQTERVTKEFSGSSQEKVRAMASLQKQPQLLNLKRPITVQHKKVAINKEDAKLLHEFAYNLPSFVHYIQIAPTFQCIIGLKDFADHLEMILQHNRNTENPVLFSYSHSYEIGDLVVSSFLFSHVAFDGKPPIPSFFLIHEKHDISAHQEFFRVLKEMVPSITLIHSPIITEGNQHKDDSITKMGLKLIPVSSWKDIISNVKEWMYANKANTQEVATGIDDVRKLMSSESLQKYHENLEKCKENWGPALQEYFMSNIHHLVETKYGRWNLEEWGIFNPYTGVSDKQNESLETVMQSLKAWGNASVYAIAVACYLMQHFVRKEVRDGANGIGRFVAKIEINAYKNAMTNWKPIPFLCLPENIVHYIKDDQIVVQDGAVVEKTEGDAKKTLFKKGKQIYEHGYIHHDASNQAFVVKDPEKADANFIVKLYPRASCSCDSTMFCQHIIAVKMSIGIDMQSDMERLDMKFVSRALKSCENAAEGIKTRRRRKKRPNSEALNFDPSNKRDCMIGHKTEPASDDSDDENEAHTHDNRHVDFFNQSTGQVGYFP